MKFLVFLQLWPLAVFWLFDFAHVNIFDHCLYWNIFSTSIYRKFKGNAQFVKNMTFGLWGKTIAQFRKIFHKIPMNTHATISIMLVCQSVYAEALFDFKGWLEKTLDKKALVMDSLYAWKFIKKWLEHICFPVNFAKPSRTTNS